MKKNLIILAISFGVTFAILNTKRLFKKRDLVPIKKSEIELPFYSNCKNPVEGFLEIESRLVVHKDFAVKFNLNKNPEVAVKEQLKYLRGLFHFQRYPNFRAIPKEMYDLKVKSITKVQYPKEVEFDFDNGHPDLFPKSFQIKRSVKKGEAAVEINYTAKMDITQCGVTENKLNKLDITLPLDPYLAYWYVPVNKRKEVKFGKDKIIANPCVGNRYAMLKHPPHYWYIWRPEKTGKDFKCRELLQDNRDVLRIQANFIEKKTKRQKLNFEFLSSKDEFNISILLGHVGHHDSQKSLDAFKKYIQSNYMLFSKIKDKKTLAKLEKEFDYKTMDTSAAAFMITLHRLTEMIDFSRDKIDFTFFDHSFTANISGNFKKTKRSVNFKFYYGDTDVELGRDYHFKFLKRAFEEDDFIFYVSHAGHGRNLSLKNMQQKLKLSDSEFKELLNSKDYQFLAIVACFSSAYHDKEYFELRDDSKKSDLLLVGTEGYSYQIPMTILKLIDNDLDIQKHIKKYVPPKEIFLIKREN